MNKIYSLVWNASLGQLVVASELASARTGGSSKSEAAATVDAPSPSATSLALGLLLPAVFMVASTVSTPAAAQTKYFRVSSTGTDNTSATGLDSIAIGIGASSKNTSVNSGSVAIGMNVSASGDGSVALGPQNSASGVDSFSALYGASASGQRAIAIGANAKSTATNTIAFGLDSKANQINAVALGQGALSQGNSSLAAGSTAQANADFSVALGSNAVVNATSTGSVAIGQNVTVATGTTYAVAIGGGAQASKSNGVALGFAAKATNLNALALGQSSQAQGSASLAAGSGAVAGADNSVALGVSSVINAGATGAVALGQSATVAANATSAISIGLSSQATVANAVALGQNALSQGNASLAAGSGAKASAASAVAVGDSANAAFASAIAIGRAATPGSALSIAVGDAVTTGATGQNVAIGSNGTNANSSSAAGGAVAIGRAQKATGNGAVAIGDPNTANGNGAVALGENNVAAGSADGTVATTGAVAIGSKNIAVGTGSVALGSGSNASAAGSLAFGNTATANNANDVALGSGSTTAKANATPNVVLNGTTYNFAGSAPGSVVSVGALNAERQITNVAAGRLSASSTDAVNGSQLFATNTEVGALNDRAKTLGNNVASAVGGGSTYDPATGKLSAPTYTVGGTTYNNVGGALDSLAKGGAKSKYFNANSTGTDSTATGTDSVAIGQSAVATNANDVALGANSTTAAANPIASGTINGATYTYAGAAPGSVVSVGALNAERQITNVAAGRVSATSTDAVNGSQLFATNTEVGVVGDRAKTLGNNVASAVGGGSTYDPATGKLSAPTYTVGGTTYNNVGGALDSLAKGGAKSKYFNANSTGVDSAATGTDSVAIGQGAVATNANDVALGANSTTAAANPTASGTINGATYTYAGAAPGSVVSVGALNAERQITNVAAGRVSATSTDAVNGSQLFATNTEVGVVGDRAKTLGSNVASAVGGGSTYDPATGKLSAPVYTVGGNTYNNVGDALTQLSNGGAKSKYFNANSTGTDSIATGVDSVAIGQGAVATNANDVALGANSVSATANATVGSKINGTDYTYAGGTASSVVSVGTSGAERQITNVAAGRVSATSTDAVNGSQLFATNTEVGAVGDRGKTLGNNVATSLGGGATYDPATGKLGAPTYTVNGTTYDNVGGALGKVDTTLDSLAKGGAKSKYFNANSTGADSSAAGADSVAIGQNAVATNANDVALGANSVTAAANATTGDKINGTDYTYAGGTASSVVSVGTSGTERQITNVAAGRVTASSTDAVNGSQLFATNTEVGAVGDRGKTLGNNVATSLGGGATYDPATGKLGAPTYTVNGTTYDNVGGALGKVDTTLDNLAKGGAKSKYFNANSTGVDSSAAGADAVAIGQGAVANNTNDVALGANSLTAAANATTGDKINGTDYTYAGGTPGSVVSVGADGAERQITNVAAGRVSAASTDAVNGSQLFATNTEVGAVGDRGKTLGNNVATSLGGGATYDPATGKLGAPTYTVNGTTYDNVGGALGKVDTTLDSLAKGGAKSKYFNANSTGADNSATGTDSVAIGQNAVATNANDVALGANSVTAAANATTGDKINGTDYTYAGGTPGSVVSVGANGAERQITNVAAGRVSATSTDAVNGSQLFATNTEVGVVGDRAKTLGNNVASAVGGGSTYDPATGKLSAPVYTVGGNTYNNVGDALTQLSNGGAKSKYFNANSTGIDSSATGADSVAIGQGAVATNANDVALGANSVTAAASATTGDKINGTDYTYAGGTPGSVVSVGAVGAERQITNVAAGRVTASSTDAINGSQLFATNTEVGAVGDRGKTLGNNVATSLGGGATYDPATGKLGAPSYTVNGTTYDNVGGALGKVDTTLDNLAKGGAKSKYFNANSTGIDSTATGADSVAIGQSAVANNANDVALGANSVTAAVNATTGDKINGTDYTYAGGTPGSVVSVGAVGAERQITNMAAGRVSADSTDAVNGSQLFATNTEVGAVGDRGKTLGNNVATSLGGGATYDPATGKLGAPVYTVNGTTYDNVGGALGKVDTTLDNLAKGGAKSKYFNANSTGVDSTATGADSVAIGQSAVATNANDVALGANSVTAAANATAGDKINGTDYTYAGGTPGSVVSVGAVGAERQITNVAAGRVSATSTDAVNGSQLFATNTEIGAVGDRGKTLGNNVATSLGGGATYDPATGKLGAPTYTVNGTTYDNVGGALDSLAKGGAKSKYFNANSTGVDSTATGTDSVAIGQSAVATNANDVALGANSVTAAVNATTGGKINGTDYTYAGGTPGSVVSVGAVGAERQITNVAAGRISAASTDAVNGSQLFATNTEIGAVGDRGKTLGSNVATSLGGGATYDPATGKLGAPTYTIDGTTYDNVGGALGKVDNALDNLSKGGAKSKYFNANSSGTDSTATGTDSVAIGQSAVANNANDVALGANSVTAAANATTGDKINGTDYTYAGGTAGSVVSVGAVGAERQITNVAAGRVTASSTDAVNGSQLFATNTEIGAVGDRGKTLGNSVATSLGGGATYDPATGKLGAPTYTVNGATYDNVGGALDSLAKGGAKSKYFNANSTGTDSTATGADSVAIGQNAVANNANDVALGANSVTAAANATTGDKINGTDYTYAGSAPGSVVSVGAVGAERQITNVAAGRVTASSTDAVNGSQLFATNTEVGAVGDRGKTLGNNVATSLGGGATYDPATGKLGAPTYTVNGTTYDNVGGALGKVDTTLDSLAKGGAKSKYFNANSTGADSSATGTDSVAIGQSAVATNANDVALGANSVTAAANTTTGDKINGTDYTYAGSAPGSVVSVGAVGAERQITNVAAGRVNATSTDAVNGSQLFATNTEIGAVGDRGKTLGNNIASAVGGGSTYDPATGKLSAPTYTINGATYDNVGGALDSLAKGGAKSKYFNANSTGADSSATGTDSVAIGQSAVANNANDVALGASSVTAAANATTGDKINGTDYTYAGSAPGSVVSVGAVGTERQITNVAAGRVTASSTDAVNGSQLFATNTEVGAVGDRGKTLGNNVATSLGGGATYDPATGKLGAPTYTVGGSTYDNVGGALGKVDTTLDNLAKGGAKSKYFNANSTGIDSTATGTDSVAIGQSAVAANANDVALGANSVSAAVNATTGDKINGTDYTYAGSAPGSVVSVGAVGAERQITNVAAGRVSAASTDAVNGSQLFATNTEIGAVGDRGKTLGNNVASSLGGGATYDNATGKVSAPTYTINGATYDNVGGALDSLAKGGAKSKYFNANSTGADSSATGTDSVAIGQSAVATNANDVALGANSLTAAANATTGDKINGTDYTYAGGTPGSVVSVGAVGAERQITNVAAGRVDATSTDAVNGSQLFATNTEVGAVGDRGKTLGGNIATSLGGGATYDPATGKLGAPTYTVGGSTYDNVGGALGKVDTTLDNLAKGGAKSKYFNANSAGTDSTATGADSVAIGQEAIASGTSAIAMGRGALAQGDYGIAQGDGVVSGSTGRNVAIGSDGTRADSSTASGGAVAIGRGQKATGNGAVAIGDPNTANGDGAVALGENNVAAGAANGGTAANGAVAIGNGNIATGQGSLALGNTSQAKAAGSIALGDTAIANNANDVALGSGSTTATANATIGDKINGTDYTYAGNAPGSVVSVGAAGAERQITNVAAGRVTATSTDAVTGSQLFATNTELGQVGTRGKNLGNDIATRLGGGAKYDEVSGNLAAPAYDINGTTYDNVGDALSNLAKGGAKSKYFNANSTGADSTATGTDSVAIGQSAVATNANDVALGANSVTAAANATTGDKINGTDYTYAGGTPGSVVSVGAVGAERQITNVAAGRVTASSTDAVNGSQLFATNTEVGAVGDRGKTLGNNVATSLGGGATYDPATGKLGAPTYTVNGTTYDNVGGALGKVDTTLDSLAKGGAKSKYFNANSTGADSSAAGTDSVAIGQNAVANNANDVALGANSVTAAANATSGDKINGTDYTYAGGTPGSVVSVGAVGTERQITNVAAGRVTASSTDAVNGSQLFATNTEIGAVGDRGKTLGNNIATSLGGGATYDPATGKLGAPTYTINGSTYDNVGGALGKVDTTLDSLAKGGAKSKYFNANSTGADSTATGADSVAIGQGAVANNAGDVALGAGSVTAAANATGSGIVNGTTYTYAGATPTSVISVGAAGAERQITNVAAGRVSSDSTDAINGSQLFATNQEVDKLGQQIGAINNGGGIKYVRINSTAADATAGGADSVAIGPAASSGGVNSVALGNGANASTDNSVALGAGSTTSAAVAVAGGKIAGNDYAYAGSTPTGVVSVGSAGGERQLTNVAAGRVSSDSTDAVNGSQLNATNQAVDKIDNRVTTVETRVGTIEGKIDDISKGGSFRVSDDVAAGKPAANGKNSVAGGSNATAAGDNSTALGNSAAATATGSVALGNGSVADRANTVSVGSSGNERQITNVAAGVRDTDAANVGQIKAASAGTVQYDQKPDGSVDRTSLTLNRGGPAASLHNVAAGVANTDAVNVGQLNRGLQDTLSQANSYTDQRLGQIQGDMWNLRRDMRGGVASALAVAGLPQAYLPGKNMAAVAIGSYQGEAGIAFGLSGITEDGHVVYKLQATGNTASDWGASVGVGYQW